MTKKVLIIDDDLTFQKVITVKLQSLGYEVISSYDGEDGLKKATKENPDLILLDVKMPKMDGITFLKKFRSMKKVPEVPVLFTSNMSTMDYVSEGVALGVKGYIVKSDESLDTIVNEVETLFDNN